MDKAQGSEKNNGNNISNNILTQEGNTPQGNHFLFTFEGTKNISHFIALCLTKWVHAHSQCTAPAALNKNKIRRNN
jgi:hypothetical protein